MKNAAWTKSIFFALMACAIAGCATQKINWQARVGNYTYDQAVKDFGPPDKSAKLTDGTTIADWLVREGHTIVAPEPYLAPVNGFGPATPANNQTYVPSYYMQLTFAPDGELKEYKNFSR